MNNMLKYREPKYNPLNKSSVSDVKQQKKIVGKINSILVRNNTNNSTISKPTDKEHQKIQLPMKQYQFIAIDVSEIERGVIITLKNESNVLCEITLSALNIVVDKEKVKHTFPMPIFFNSTRLLKIQLRFFDRTFAMEVRCVKGKIKDKNVATSIPADILNQTMQSFGKVIVIDPFQLIQKAQTFRRKKFGSTQRKLHIFSSRSTNDIISSLAPEQKQTSIKLSSKADKNVHDLPVSFKQLATRIGFSDTIIEQNSALTKEDKATLLKNKSAVNISGYSPIVTKKQTETKQTTKNSYVSKKPKSHIFAISQLTDKISTPTHRFERKTQKPSTAIQARSKLQRMLAYDQDNRFR